MERMYFYTKAQTKGRVENTWILKPPACVIFICVFVILITDVTSDVDVKEQQILTVNTIDSDALLESMQHLKDHFVGALETVANKSLFIPEFMDFLFPELEDEDVKGEDVIKEEIGQLSIKAEELAGQLDQNEDGQISMDEVLPLDSDRKTKVDEILKEIVKIQTNIDDKFGGQDGELLDETRSMEQTVAHDPDLIDLDEDFQDGEQLDEDLANYEDLNKMDEDLVDLHDEL